MTTIVRYAAIIISMLFALSMKAQQGVSFITKEKEKKVDILVDGKFFTSYCYPDNLDKPVLYPLLTSSGITLTRGFPLDPRPNERVDHPHHVGIWFNYGNVNGLDFWNNSYAIKAADKPKYGSIRHRQILKTENGKDKGTLVVASDWVDHEGKVLLKEVTTFTISGSPGNRTIERTAVLTAQQQKVSFQDNKEGMLGLRVCRELELPSNKPELFTDAQGNPTTVPALNNEGVTGNYLTSEGKTGDSAWGTRGRWCLLSGRKNGTPVSIAIIDHAANPGYPTYWHARGYGLFAANTLGQEALSGGKQKLNFSLDAGQSATFRYRIVLNDGTIPTSAELDKTASGFSSNTAVMNTNTSLDPIDSRVIHWAELPVKKEAQRESRKLAEGTTHEFEYFEIHATTQFKGAVPRPAHTQKDIEEVIIIKEGTLKCTIGDKTAVLGAGSVLLIPPLEAQVFENVGNGPVTYYVFMFRARNMDMERSRKAGGALLLNADSLPFTTTARGGTKKYFNRPTAMCENYEMHITQLANKGASHTPHQHVDTEIILMIDGETEMTIDGKHYTAGPGDLYIAESGKMHGIGNASEKPCSYFAFKWR